MGEVDHEENAIDEGIAKSNESVHTAQNEAINKLKSPVLDREGSIYGDDVDPPNEADKDEDPKDVEDDPISLSPADTKGFSWSGCRSRCTGHSKAYDVSSN
jgi:hypothetical protein